MQLKKPQQEAREVLEGWVEQEGKYQPRVKCHKRRGGEAHYQGDEGDRCAGEGQLRVGISTCITENLC